MNHDTLQLWPVIVIVDDGYDPRVAQAVIDAAAQVDAETLSALWVCHGWAAEQDAGRRVN